MAFLARRADGAWRFGRDHRGLNTIAKPSVKPPPHADQLVDGIWGPRSLPTKRDLAVAYMQFCQWIREEDRRRHKTSESFRIPGGVGRTV